MLIGGLPPSMKKKDAKKDETDSMVDPLGSSSGTTQRDIQSGSIDNSAALSRASGPRKKRAPTRKGFKPSSTTRDSENSERLSSASKSFTTTENPPSSNSSNKTSVPGGTIEKKDTSPL